ncbi:MAG: ABC transporter ATP-binding protein [Nitrospirales bacterium]|nr:ABC transporter ATP-binding protein [Nitrospirales bacterium]
MKSNNVAIRVENVSKCYRIGLKEEIHDSLGKSFISFLKSPLRNYKKYRSLYRFDDAVSSTDSNKDFENPSDVFWALKNLAFELKQGEVLGIIGKNGAGKSTILKILSKITRPTFGQVEIHGRNSSLLEVGTGFHPELTGRENVYLNGTVLGMKKKEIERKFDAIVDFSGVEKFLDTPVKRYSSGMTVRLAFAVAAHLEPEILIIDEVLAVGDAEFQAKCLGKMSSVAKEGRTVLFVSHNMGAIAELCSRVIWLEGGRLKQDGFPSDVVMQYLSSSEEKVGCWSMKPDKVLPNHLAWLRKARILSSHGNTETTVFRFNERPKVEIEYEVKDKVRELGVYFWIRDSFGNVILISNDNDGSPHSEGLRGPGIYHSVCELPANTLKPGRYFVGVGITGRPQGDVQDEHRDVMNFSISDVGYPFKRRAGVISPYLDWKVTRHEEQEVAGGSSRLGGYSLLS